MTNTTICAIVMFLIGTVPSIGENWPQHRGVSRDGVTTEVSGWNGKNWPIGKMWQTHVGDGCTSPLLVDGKVYVMGWQFTGKARDRKNPNGTDTVYALDATTGNPLRKLVFFQQGGFANTWPSGRDGGTGGSRSVPGLFGARHRPEWDGNCDRPGFVYGGVE